MVLTALLSGCQSNPLGPPSARGGLRNSLTFHASFDGSADAGYALGDRRIYTAPSFNKQDAAQPGLHASNIVVLAKGQGRFGDAIWFNQKPAPLVFFKAAKNLSYRTNNWSGTVSFWLNADPVELAPGFCDPIQITPRAWNDACFFVEFEKREEVPFRLGVYADYKVWNPGNLRWDDLSFIEKPLLGVTGQAFGKARWTHVVFTFDKFNTGRPDGVAKLYLNGIYQGALSPRVQTFTWDPSKALVMLGASYIGLLDELSIFDRALTPEEVLALNQLPAGIPGLLQ
jgi:hypothetical protein